MSEQELFICIVPLFFPWYIHGSHDGVTEHVALSTFQLTFNKLLLFVT